MHAFGVFLISFPPAAVLEVKTLAIAAGVYSIIQVLKQAPVLQPYLKGWLAIALNVLLSITGALMVIPAGQVFTFPTIVTVLSAALAAAGVHGTVNSLQPSNGAAADAAADKPQAASTGVKS